MKLISTPALRWVAPCLAALFLLLTGCSDVRLVRRVQATMPDGRTTLDRAYAELLENPRWERVIQEPDAFVRVTGSLKGGGPDLEVYYTTEGEPPRLAWFVSAGRRQPGTEFPAWLRERQLNRILKEKGG